MTPSDFNVERTAIGMQYIIPGAERTKKPKRRAYKADGDQLVMCGRPPVGKVFLTIMQCWSVLPCVRPVYAALLHGRWP